MNQASSVADLRAELAALGAAAERAGRALRGVARPADEHSGFGTAAKIGLLAFFFLMI